MDFNITELLKSLVAFVAIVNPIGVVPIFLALTSDYTEKDRKHTAYMSSFSVGLDSSPYRICR